MSATRLLVLGAVRIFQPANGYLVRRELLTWGVDSWAATNPGSIYNMLRTLTREGLLEVVRGAGGGAEDGARPASTSYRLTMDGENAYTGLLASALWEVHDRDPHLVLAALCFLPTMSRAEALEAFESREQALLLRLRATAAAVRQVQERRSAPPHAVELFHHTTAALTGDLEWTRGARRRLAEGHYRFAGEPGADELPHEGRWFGPLDAPRGP